MNWLMNLPNRLTLARILLVPVFLTVVTLQVPYGNYIALALFLFGAGTDALDGYLARKHRQETRWGKLMDPLADKLLVSAALISLVELGRIPGWAVMIIIGRELAVTGLRTFLAGEGTVIPASFLGKIKTVTQIVAIAALFLQPVPYHPAALSFGNLAMTAAVVLTVWSGVDYFTLWWSQIKEGDD